MRFPNADAYQMLAYCTAFGLGQGTLLYARDDEHTDRTHRVVGDRAVINVRALDMEQAPEEVLSQVTGLASEVARGARASINGHVDASLDGPYRVTLARLSNTIPRRKGTHVSAETRSGWQSVARVSGLIRLLPIHLRHPLRRRHR
jgi:hypothetical protein